AAALPAPRPGSGHGGRQRHGSAAPAPQPQEGGAEPGAGGPERGHAVAGRGGGHLGARLAERLSTRLGTRLGTRLAGNPLRPPAKGVPRTRAAPEVAGAPRASLRFAHHASSGGSRSRAIWAGHDTDS